MPPTMAGTVPRRNNKKDAAKQQTTLTAPQRNNNQAGGLTRRNGSIESSMTDGKNASTSAQTGEFGFFGFAPSGTGGISRGP